MNFYSYVRNKPTIYTDAWGLLDPGIYQYAQPVTETAKYVGPAAVAGGSAVAASSGSAATLAGTSVAAAPAAAVAAVVVGGLAVGYAIGYYPGQIIARRLYPEQFPDTMTQPQTQRQPTTVTDDTTCDVKPRPVPVPTPTPPQNRDRWTCNAKCHVNNFSNVPNAPDFCYGTGSGPSETSACQNAMNVAQASSPPGTYARHCRCTECWKF
jgi:hypothetical protein